MLYTLFSIPVRNKNQKQYILLILLQSYVNSSSICQNIVWGEVGCLEIPQNITLIYYIHGTLSRTPCQPKQMSKNSKHSGGLGRYMWCGRKQYLHRLRGWCISEVCRAPVALGLMEHSLKVRGKLFSLKTVTAKKREHHPVALINLKVAYLMLANTTETHLLYNIKKLPALRRA